MGAPDLFVGIDPGQKGALFSLTSERQFHSAIPNLTPHSLIEWIEMYCPPPSAPSKQKKGREIVFILEKAQPMPKQGVCSMFTYGEGYGELIGILKAFKQPYELVTPQAWTKVMLQGCPKSIEGKKRNAYIAKALFPDFNLIASSRATMPHEGLVDALLIAEYSRKLLKAEAFLKDDGFLTENI